MFGRRAEAHERFIFEVISQLADARAIDEEDIRRIGDCYSRRATTGPRSERSVSRRVCQLAEAALAAIQARPHEDALTALGIEGLHPDREDDWIEVEAEIDEDDDEIRDKLLPKLMSLSETFDRTDVFDLSAAIRRGDTKEAELLLDRLVAEDQNVTEWVQQGRYSRKARNEGAQAEGLKAAA